MPRPMPRVPPVTTATLSGIAISVTSALGSLLVFENRKPPPKIFQDALACEQEASKQVEAGRHKYLLRAAYKHAALIIGSTLLILPLLDHVLISVTVMSNLRAILLHMILSCSKVIIIMHACSNPSTRYHPFSSEYQ